MALDPALTGRIYRSVAPYQVSAEKIAEFRASIGDSAGPADEAPFTFPIVVAFSLMTELMADPGAGISLHNVVHRDERVDQHRPIRAGDRVVGTLVVDSVRSAAGVDLIATRTEIATVEGEPVCTATATLVHRQGLA